MNLRQRIVVFVGLLLEAAMLLYPPWKVHGWADDIYRPLFSTPVSGSSSIPTVVRLVSEIDTQRLGIQCVIVAILTIGVILLLGERKNA